MATKQSVSFRTTIRPFLKAQVKKYLPIEAINYLYHFPVALLSVLFHFYPARNLTVIGVTGTSGKTTVVSIIYHLLKKAGLPISMVSTIKATIADDEYDTGFHVTNPEPWQLQKYFQQAVKAGSKYFVLEITSHGLAQFRNIGAKIDIGVVTNVTHEHLDYHKNFKNYLLTKAKIFSGVKYSIINKDDKNFRVLKNLSSGRVVSFGIKNDADYTPAKFPFKTNLPGEFNKYNCLAAICVAKILGISDEIIRKSLANIPTLPGRMEEVNSGQNFRIFIDFAHKPDALEKVLQTTQKKPHKRIIVMFGVAGLRDKSKRPIMGEIATRLADIAVFTAEDPRTENLDSLINQIVQGAHRTSAKEINERSLEQIDKILTKQHVFLRVPDRKKAINLIIKKIAQKGDIVLFCGKGHEKSMCFGTTEYPWDEKKEIVEALKGHAKNKKRIHFIGIKGVGMTALAIYAKEKDFLVSGSDVKEEFLTDKMLKKFKIPFKIGFERKDLKTKPDLAIVTGAHGGMTNKEAVALAQEGIEVITHGQALGRFLNEKKGISVSGVGGKSTTSAMIASLLVHNKLDPSYAIGVPDIFPLGQPGHFGKGDYFVVEADEYASCPHTDPTPRFLYQKPKMIVITNVEYDHPDIYSSFSETLATFSSFIKNMEEDGLLVINGDNRHNQILLKEVTQKTQTYGFSSNLSYQIEKVHYQEGKTTFFLKQGNLSLGDYQLNVPGKFNVLNATAAIVVGLQLGLTTSQVKAGLSQFFGTKRRFELIGEKGKVKVYDDYAHHPSEIKMTLMAVKEWFPSHKIICLFQPHTYSRTKSLLTDFARSFGFADEVVILPIFPSAREEVDPEINSSILASKISMFHPRVAFAGSEEKILERIKEIKEDTIVLTMGAGDIYKMAPKILQNI